MSHPVGNQDAASLYANSDLIYARKTYYCSHRDISFGRDRQWESQGEAEVLSHSIVGFVVAISCYAAETTYLPSIIRVWAMFC